VIRALIDRGLDVPGDVSVTGWDNNEACQYLPPALTSVEVDLESLGRNAMLSLVKSISGRAVEPSVRPLQHAIWRESTGPAHH
jgi:LacI family transcriptional regulator